MWMLFFALLTYSNVENINLFSETIDYFHKNHLLDSEVKKVVVEKDKESPESSTTIHDEITVLPITSFEAGQRLVNEGYRPLILDMANASSPGGSVEIGKIAQEETLCLQSNLFTGLRRADSLGYYPIPDRGGILVKDVLFFRDEVFNFLTHSFLADVFACAAYDCNLAHKEDKENRLRGYDCPIDAVAYEEGTKAKIRALLTAAIENNNDSLVLSAFGCGAFRNDPEAMALFFKQVLNEEVFKGRFLKITFAIPNMLSENYQVFAEAFNKGC